MSPDLSIRLATPADEAAVGALLRASYPVLMAGAYDPRVLDVALPLMTRANGRLLASGSYYLAIRRDGAVVGAGGWTEERPGTGEVSAGLGHVRHFATHPDCLRAGVGRAILGACEAAAGARGIGRFQCYASLNAEGFYAALGFRRLRPLDVAMGPGIVFPSVLMEKALAA